MGLHAYEEVVERLVELRSFDLAALLLRALRAHSAGFPLHSSSASESPMKQSSKAAHWRFRGAVRTSAVLACVLSLTEFAFTAAAFTV